MSLEQQKSQCDRVPDSEYWVFGYGSLIWKPPPVFEDRVPGFIRGHVRRFWQASTDHRGTPEAPGRVVTLIPHDEWKLIKDYHDHQEDEITWGVAYKIAAADVKAVKEYLDFREKNGYSCHLIDVYQKNRAEPVVKNAVVYIGTTDNEAYVGPAPLEEIAMQIYKSHGPSGPNRDYLLNLATALRIVAPDSYDPHLFDLEKRVLDLCEKYGGETPKSRRKKLSPKPSPNIDNKPNSFAEASMSLPSKAGTTSLLQCASIMELTSFSSIPKVAYTSKL